MRSSFNYFDLEKNKLLQVAETTGYKIMIEIDIDLFSETVNHRYALFVPFHV